MRSLVVLCPGARRSISQLPFFGCHGIDKGKGIAPSRNSWISSPIGGSAAKSREMTARQLLEFCYTRLLVLGVDHLVAQLDQMQRFFLGTGNRACRPLRAAFCSAFPRLLCFARRRLAPCFRAPGRREGARHGAHWRGGYSAAQGVAVLFRAQTTYLKDAGRPGSLQYNGVCVSSSLN